MVFSTMINKIAFLNSRKKNKRFVRRFKMFQGNRFEYKR